MHCTVPQLPLLPRQLRQGAMLWWWQVSCRPPPVMLAALAYLRTQVAPCSHQPGGQSSLRGSSYCRERLVPGLPAMQCCKRCLTLFRLRKGA